MEELPPKFVLVNKPRHIGTSVVNVQERMQLDILSMKKNPDGSVQYVSINSNEGTIKKNQTFSRPVD